MTAPAYYEWRLGGALLLAQLQATLARLDIGATGNACVRLYTTARPEDMGTSPAPWLEIPLARPAGVIADGLLVLQPQSVAGTMVLTSGVPRWAELVAADGTVLAEGGVTAEGVGGCFEVAGGTVPDGEVVPVFYAGGLVTLTGSALG
ncbi:hypothetical protein [Comamonas jiangduensis]|uniref:hypothetical protein n=1 Tax=Comamonas jiangduensis TaxID=1194168 RepID=UPI0028A7A8D2|nr:hypothetical protein [Comamonas jiangduensis]